MGCKKISVKGSSYRKSMMVNKKSFLIGEIIVGLLLNLLILPACSQTPAEFPNEITPTPEPPSFCGQVDEIPETECQALLAFYESTNGDSWRSNTGWLETFKPCSWYGIRCEDGHVHSLTMNDNDMSGVLPTEIGALEHIQVITLYFNQIGGELPPSLGNLTQLEKLILHNNQFMGSLPSEFWQLRSVKVIDLQENELHGRLPAEIGQLTNLESLNLINNEFSGEIPAELGQLVKLRGLFLANNNLSGSVPEELGNLTNLFMLNLDANNLSGELPEGLQDIPRSGYDLINRSRDDD